jgi:hypothetical protein
MNKLVIFLTLFLPLITIAQIPTIKVKKQIPIKTITTATVTLAGLVKGDCKLGMLYMDKHFKIINNTANLTLVYSEACFYTHPTLKCYREKSDSLSRLLMDDLLLKIKDKPVSLYIEKIKALDKNKDTVLLNPIILKLRR